MSKKTVYDVRLPDQDVYHAECPIIHALDIIGGKWKLPVLWHLARQESVRYNELRRNVHGISNMMLTKCLRELEEEGLIRRVQYDEIPPRVEYSLAGPGKALLPALNGLYRWGEERMNAQGSNPQK